MIGLPFFSWYQIKLKIRRNKKWDATESISSNDNCNDSTQQALIGRKMSQRFFLLPIIDEESIKSDWTKNNFLNPGGSRNSRVGLQLAALVRWFSGLPGCIGMWGPPIFVRWIIPNFQSNKADYTHHINLSPPRFLTFLRPWLKIQSIPILCHWLLYIEILICSKVLKSILGWKKAF